MNGKPGKLLEFDHVLHVPALQNNLLSVLYLTQNKGYTVVIKPNKLFFYHNKALLCTATVNSQNAAHLDGNVVPVLQYAGIVSTCPLDLTLWHCHFAHLNHGHVELMLSKGLVNGITLKSKVKPDSICEPCLAGKMHRKAVPKVATHQCTQLLELVHSDVHGPLPVASCHGLYKYWISFIDDASRFWAVLPLKRKGDAFVAFQQFKAYAEKQLDCKIKAL